MKKQTLQLRNPRPAPPPPGVISEADLAKVSGGGGAPGGVVGSRTHV